MDNLEDSAQERCGASSRWYDHLPAAFQSRHPRPFLHSAEASVKLFELPRVTDCRDQRSGRIRCWLAPPSDQAGGQRGVAQAQSWTQTSRSEIDLWELEVIGIDWLGILDTEPTWQMRLKFVGSGCELASVGELRLRGGGWGNIKLSGAWSAASLGIFREIVRRWSQSRVDHECTSQGLLLEKISV